MPQSSTVGQYAAQSDTYNVYADNFDLSLLPNSDGEVPLSPQSQLSLDLPEITNIDYIPTTVFHHQEFQIKSETITSDEYYSTSDMLMVSTPQNAHHDQQYTSHFYNPPQLSPPQDQFVTIFPPSPAPSHDSSQYHHSNIKQEFCPSTTTLYPPSPPDSHGSLSPRGHFEYFKGEISGGSSSEASGSDSESCIDLNQLLNEADLRDAGADSSDHHLLLDHQLLRGYLQDTSFQRKHNLKPLALDSLLMGGWASGDDIGPVILLALEQARKDVQQTCAALNIPAGEFRTQNLSFFLILSYRNFISCAFILCKARYTHGKYLLTNNKTRANGKYLLKKFANFVNFSL